MVAYTVSVQAYFKIFFHAAKHPHKPVNGVLLGKPISEGALIVDAIPLLHHWTSLSPMMEIGLDLVSSLFQVRNIQSLCFTMVARREGMQSHQV
jgi:hypothetical protein